MPRYFFSSKNVSVCQIKKLSHCTQSQTLLKSNESRRERVICISAAALGDHCSFDQVENVVFFPGNQNLSSGCSHQMYGLDARLLHFDSIVYYLFEDFTLLGKVTSFGICRCPPDMIFVKMFTLADFGPIIFYLSI